MKALRLAGLARLGLVALFSLAGGLLYAEEGKDGDA